MTYSAQAALRRIMEMHFKTTKFCLICNYISCIIEPIKSRCAKFRFKPLPRPLMVARLSQIASEEHVLVDPEVWVFIIRQALEKLVEISAGDLRKAINYLQTGRHLSSNITYEAILDICSVCGLFLTLVDS
ncbi:replication factor C subunit 4-like [Octopus sinensis]|uniref:Replication factor C subunit 4-like n=1 Tax=Octopus sinensis TaxID=2607531 RepID=A0A7E6EID1_9MOLL|nr:replication factor C subunit 4-like [Octopus sinensis]